MSKTALVTGATSGIGRAFAERLATDGYDLVLVGRSRDRLDEFLGAHPGTAVRPVVAELSTDDGIDTVAGICAAEPLDLLVNNAGVAHYMPLTELPADKARELLGVKVLAPTLLTRAAVIGMVERGHSAVINVAGMIAFSAPPRTPRCRVVPCTPELSRTWWPCPRPSARRSRAPASRSRSSVPASWPPSSISGRAST